MEGDSHTVQLIIGSLRREAAAFYRLTVPSCGSSLGIKNVWYVLWGVERKNTKVYSEASTKFYVYFGISNMLVHQHGALLESAGCVVFLIFMDLWSP